MGATASLAAIAISGVQTVSTMRGQANQADAEVRANTTNAALADAQAADAITRGEQEASKLRGETKQLIGAQRTGYAAQGVDVGTGSAADVQAESAGLGEYDALTIRNNARREAFGYQIDAQNSRTRAEYTRAASRTATTNTLLTGAANLYGMYRSSDFTPPRQKSTSWTAPRRGY